MQAASDHFLLYTETSRGDDGAPRWKFALQSVGGDEHFSADDSELNSRLSRLELLAVVRGLEAIDRPARVTLLTSSRYVSHGIRRELNHWREDQWQWERFGEMVPIRDRDLWQRVDRALGFHRVECCKWHGEGAMTDSTAQSSARTNTATPASLLAAAFATFRRGILTPFSALWRPTFTRAA